MRNMKDEFMNHINGKFIKYLKLHIIILLFTMVTITSKYVSKYEFLSMEYLCGVGVIVGILGVYAILWQQIIKDFSPSVAYSNKSVTTIWVLIFSFVFFHEEITLNNILGAIVIILGVILVSQND